MSKSKGNVVDPDDMIAEVRRRRAAALRDVRGAAREGNRVDRRRPRGQLPLPGARLAAGRSAAPRRSAAKASRRRRTLELNDAERALRRKTHDTIRRVTLDLDPRVHLNTAVSALMELVNELYAFCGRPGCSMIGRDRRRCGGGRQHRASGDHRGAEGSGRGAGPDALAVRAAHGRGAVGAARARRRRRRGRLAGVRRSGRQAPRRSSCRCRSTARSARA